jgi:hypothetical protein
VVLRIDEFWGETIINEISLCRSILQCLHHHILWFQIVMDSLRGVYNLQNINNLLCNRKDLFNFIDTLKFFNVLREVAVVSRHYIIRTQSCISIGYLVVNLLKIMQDNCPKFDDVWNANLVSWFTEFHLVFRNNIINFI